MKYFLAAIAHAVRSKELARTWLGSTSNSPQQHQLCSVLSNNDITIQNHHNHAEQRHLYPLSHHPGIN